MALPDVTGKAGVGLLDVDTQNPALREPRFQKMGGDGFGL